MSAIQTLHTERLTLRPISLDEDAPALFRIYKQREAMRFMPTLPHQSVDQTRAELAQKMALDGAYVWAVCLKDNDTPIGEIHYLGKTRIPGMGYMLHPQYWGQGLTVEACRATLDFGFKHIGYDRVELWIDENNSSSIRVAQKLGFKPRGRLAQKYSHEREYHFMLVYGMLAQEWRADSAHLAPKGPRLFSMEPALLVHDVAATVEFYRDKLGFGIDFLYGDPPTHASVSRGEWTGNMVTIQLSQVPPEHEINPAAYLYIIMDAGLDRLCEQYRDCGVGIIEEPENQPWGLREFAIRDCNGYMLRFGTHR